MDETNEYTIRLTDAEYSLLRYEIHAQHRHEEGYFYGSNATVDKKRLEALGAIINELQKAEMKLLGISAA